MSNASNQRPLTKSLFMAGIQCLKKLYLAVHHKELAEPPSLADKSIMEAGISVGELACDVFPGGYKIEPMGKSRNQIVEETRKAMNRNDINSIYEASFELDNCFLRADIMERQADNCWNLIEVKSSTMVKNHFIYDLGFQKYILQKTGIHINSSSLMHLNNEYVYDGEALNLKELFTIERLDDEIKNIEHLVPTTINAEIDCLKKSSPPDIKPGSHCSKPVTCEFYNHCNPARPRNWIGNLPRLHANKMTLLESDGIELMEDIPDDFKLSDNQEKVKECVISKTPLFDPQLKDHISQLKFPLLYMDFETFSPAIPLFSGTSPYNQIPFQWSLHVQKSWSDDLIHHEFLADPLDDPRESFITSLLNKIESYPEGNIIVYNKSFEISRLKNLSEWFPEYSERITNVISRIWDLMAVIQKYVYHPLFKGSYSIKKVLPALLPDLSYEGMDIADGSSASVVFDKLRKKEFTESEAEKEKTALLEYCKLDTLAMVELLNYLNKTI